MISTLNKRLIRSVFCASNQCSGSPSQALVSRGFSDKVEEDTVLVDVDGKTGIATLQLNRKPVNSLNLEFMTNISDKLKALEKDRSRGVIITTTSKSVFSAGLDLLEMYKPDPDRVRAFWGSLQEMWLTLYGLKIPAACAISGHSPAGGCLIATCCDYRVMVDGKFTIGLNEAKFGLIAPSWFVDSFRNTVGHRNAELGLTLGKLFTVDEALKIGLIDEKVPSKEEAVDRCRAMILEWGQTVPVARHLSKMAMRQQYIDKLAVRRADDIEDFVKVCMDAKVQKNLDMYVQSLKKK